MDFLSHVFKWSVCFVSGWLGLGQSGRKRSARRRGQCHPAGWIKIRWWYFSQTLLMQQNTWGRGAHHHMDRGHSLWLKTKWDLVGYIYFLHFYTDYIITILSHIKIMNWQLPLFIWFKDDFNDSENWNSTSSTEAEEGPSHGKRNEDFLPSNFFLFHAHLACINNMKSSLLALLRITSLRNSAS